MIGSSWFCSWTTVWCGCVPAPSWELGFHATIALIHRIAVLIPSSRLLFWLCIATGVPPPSISELAFYFWWEGAHSSSKNRSPKAAWKIDKRREPENRSFGKRIQREAGGPRKADRVRKERKPATPSLDESVYGGCCWGLNSVQNNVSFGGKTEFHILGPTEEKIINYILLPWWF